MEKICNTSGSDKKVSKELINISSIRGRPKYKQMKSYILEHISSGQFAPGAPLPSESFLAKSAGISRNTLRQALAELEKERILQRLPGRGTFVVSVEEQNHKDGTADFSIVLPELRRNIFPNLVKGFGHEADMSHHQIMICNTNYDIKEQASSILQLLHKKISGVAIVPTILPLTPSYHIEILQEHDISVVFCIRRVEGTSAPLITWNFEECSHIAGQALIDKGHRRIAYFANFQFSSNIAYKNGLQNVLANNGLELPEDRVYFGDKLGETNKQDKLRALHRMLESKNRPTAIFCNDDNEAEAIYLFSLELGVKVPEELSIIGCGDIRRYGDMREHLTSVTVDAFELGARAANILNEMNTKVRPIYSDEKIFIQPQLYAGQTLAKSPDL